MDEFGLKEHELELKENRDRVDRIVEDLKSKSDEKDVVINANDLFWLV